MWVRCPQPDRGGVSRDHLSKHQEHTVNTSQRTTRSARPARRGWRIAAATTFAVVLSALPASARQDPGQLDPPSRATNAHFCAPERVGTQYVACDNLTGNGVPAPTWVHER